MADFGTWTEAENKVFEQTLSEFAGIGAKCMNTLAMRLPGKTKEQIRTHYTTLLVDIAAIERGTYPDPLYADEDDDDDDGDDEPTLSWMPDEMAPPSPILPDLDFDLLLADMPLVFDTEPEALSVPSSMAMDAGGINILADLAAELEAPVEDLPESEVSPRLRMIEEEFALILNGSSTTAPAVENVTHAPARSEPAAPPPAMRGRGLVQKDRREQQQIRGNSWTEEEKRMFHIGMAVHGRGNWRGISSNFVRTRTPKQVACHAQKYFKTLSTKKKKQQPRGGPTNLTSAAGECQFSIYDVTINANLPCIPLAPAVTSVAPPPPLPPQPPLMDILFANAEAAAAGYPEYSFEYDDNGGLLPYDTNAAPVSPVWEF